LYSQAGLPSLGKDVWISILHLAQMWQMIPLREDAIVQLTTLVTDPAEKLLLSDKYDVPAWSIPALLDLVNRDDTITEDVLARIGALRTLKVVALRERRFRDQASIEPHKCGTCGAIGIVQTVSTCGCVGYYNAPMPGYIQGSGSTGLVEKDIRDEFNL
jgi:hypothetical protein